MLPDILHRNLKIVFCGTAAGEKSARVGQYYAGPGNKFWRTLHQTGLTPRILAPSEFADLPNFGIGLTDLVKHASGSDSQIDFKTKGADALRVRVMKFQPRILCFNGKRAAQEFLGRKVECGVQPERIGETRLFVAPSTSGAANGFWDIRWWEELAELVRG